jgi:uncharacterized protein YbbC (DUF1343 family)
MGVSGIALLKDLEGSIVLGLVFFRGVAARAPGVFLTFLLLVVSQATASPVVPGIEGLRQPEVVQELRGLRLGVIAHQASRTRDGRHLVDLLRGELGLDLRLIFAPEHGLRTLEDDWGRDGIDPETGIPVFSLYTPARRAPEPAHWEKLDVLLVDLQDVGLRYYTYPTTLALAMRSAAAAGKPVWVLDRPNPLGGERVEGLVLDRALSGRFASYFPIPTRHGLTLGELGRLFKGYFGIPADLRVIPMLGWSRASLWSETGLDWPVPSPALTRFEQALFYAITGPLETYNLAVGRGQTNELAFQVLGAPWITRQQSRRLVSSLSALKLPGLRFEAWEWKVNRAVYAGQTARGVRLAFVGESIEAFSRIDTLEASLRILKTLSSVLGSQLKSGTASAAAFGSSAVLRGLGAGTPVETILAESREPLELFRRDRVPYLFY